MRGNSSAPPHVEVEATNKKWHTTELLVGDQLKCGGDASALGHNQKVYIIFYSFLLKNNSQSHYSEAPIYFIYGLVYI